MCQMRRLQQKRNIYRYHIFFSLCLELIVQMLSYSPLLRVDMSCIFYTRSTQVAIFSTVVDLRMPALFQGGLVKLAAGVITIGTVSYIYTRSTTSVIDDKRAKRNLAKERRTEWRDDLSRNIAPPVIKCNYYPTRKN